MGYANGKLSGSILAASAVMGGRRDYFWRYAPALKSQDLLKVSMYGDSIVAGSFSYPNDSHIWTPEEASRILTYSERTRQTGSEYFQSGGYALAGTERTDQEFTMTSGAAMLNPRFLQNSGQPSGSAGDLWIVKGQLESTGNEGQPVRLRVAGSAANGGVSTTGAYRYISFSAETAYTLIGATLSFDFLKMIASTWYEAEKIAIGGDINSDGTIAIGKIKDITLYKAARGIAVHNQGSAGWFASHGLTNIANVTGWTPDVCVVCFGTNDIRAAGDVATLKAAFLVNLTDIIAAFQAASIYPVLATIPPLAADQTNDEHVSDWNVAIAELASSQQVGFWDRWKALGNGDLTYIADGRHPTEAGYLKLAQDLANKLRGKV